jgi:hypothetical protein
MKTHALTGLSRTRQSTESFSPDEERIRALAYQLYEQRGREDGYSLDDWLRAESQITGKQPKMRAA